MQAISNLELYMKIFEFIIFQPLVFNKKEHYGQTKDKTRKSGLEFCAKMSTNSSKKNGSTDH